jgi:hypothetical protein
MPPKKIEAEFFCGMPMTKDKSYADESDVRRRAAQEARDRARALKKELSADTDIPLINEGCVEDFMPTEIRGGRRAIRRQKLVGLLRAAQACIPKVMIARNVHDPADRNMHLWVNGSRLRLWLAQEKALIDEIGTAQASRLYKGERIKCGWMPYFEWRIILDAYPDLVGHLDLTVSEKEELLDAYQMVEFHIPLDKPRYPANPSKNIPGRSAEQPIAEDRHWWEIYNTEVLAPMYELERAGMRRIRVE